MKLKYLFAALVSVLFLVLAMRGFQFRDAAAALSSADPRYILPALGSYFLSYVFRTVRWRIILAPIKKVEHLRLFRYLVIGYTANNLLPARLGEFIRAYVTGVKEGISRTSSFAGLVLERIFDGVTIVLIFTGLLFMFDLDHPWLRATAYTAALCFLGGLGFLLALTFRRAAALAFAEFFLHLLPERAAAGIRALLLKFIGGLDLLRRPGPFIASFLLSFPVWLAEGGVYYLYLQAFHVDVPWHAAALALVVVNLSAMIPSSPGMVGVFQFACSEALAIYGVAAGVGLTLSVAVHATQIIPVTVLGLVFLSRMGLSLFSLQRAAARSGEGNGGNAAEEDPTRTDNPP